MIEAGLSLKERSFIESLEHASSALEHFKLKIVNLAQSFDLLHSGVEIFDKIRDSLDFGRQMANLGAQTGATAGEMAVLSQAFQNIGSAGGAEAFLGRFQSALSGLNEKKQIPCRQRRTRPPHSPTPAPALTVSGAAGAKANSLQTDDNNSIFVGLVHLPWAKRRRLE
jgi:hypothetical protein